MMGGMLIAMTWLGYAAIVFISNPPAILLSRSEHGGSGRFFIAVVVGLITVFFALGAAAALLSDAAMDGIGGEYAIVQTVPYASLVLLLGVAAGVPLMSFMRTHLWHVATWIAMAVGVYGLLIPNLVLALQNR